MLGELTPGVSESMPLPISEIANQCGGCTKGNQCTFCIACTCGLRECMKVACVSAPAAGPCACTASLAGLPQPADRLEQPLPGGVAHNADASIHEGFGKKRTPVHAHVLAYCSCIQCRLQCALALCSCQCDLNLRWLLIGLYNTGNNVQRAFD